MATATINRRHSAAGSLSWTKTRSELGVAIKAGAPPGEIAELRRRFKFERLFDHVRKELESEPALTGGQLELLRTLLDGGETR